MYERENIGTGMSEWEYGFRKWGSPIRRREILDALRSRREFD